MGRKIVQSVSIVTLATVLVLCLLYSGLCRNNHKNSIENWNFFMSEPVVAASADRSVAADAERNMVHSTNSSAVLKDHSDLEKFRISSSQATAEICSMFESPTIAYCVTGNLRSFTQPRVWRSIKENLIKAYGGDAYTFFFVRYVHAPSDTIHVAHGQDVKKSEADAILEQFTPVYTDTSEFGEEIYNTKCDFMNGNPTKMRNIAQMYDWSRCLDKVRDVERQTGLRFSYVAKVRADTFVYQTPKPFCMRDPASFSFGNSCSGPEDWFFIIPRDYAGAAMDLYKKYMQCNTNEGVKFANLVGGPEGLANEGGGGITASLITAMRRTGIREDKTNFHVQIVRNYDLSDQERLKEARDHCNWMAGFCPDDWGPDATVCQKLQFGGLPVPS